MTNPTLAPQSDEYQQIHDGIIRLVDTARTETVRSINAIMTATYWEIGRRIVEFEQGGRSASGLWYSAYRTIIGRFKSAL
ncbi:Uncharacterized conserved protein [Salmonella enterica subsp. arizonae]|uniref:Uncharacterized conserved protein n=1 Tax=Salmonella enterica subsp. arizonae TaxID=59203 RepID=A0A379RWN3_SALER|nr:Uncharacterized conserved protein [Salmonella enterica subsp. arizonae]